MLAVTYLSMVLLRNYSMLDAGLAGVAISATSGLLVATSAVSTNLSDLELRVRLKNK